MSSLCSAAATRGRRGLADHGQDRALDRLRDRPVGGPRALRQGVRQVEPVEPPLPAEALGHAAEDLARDDPGVAARAHQRPEADRRRDPLGVDSPATASASSSAALTVAYMFEPVSPSGTG